MIQLNTDIISNRNIGFVLHDDLKVCEPHSHTFFELAYIVSGNAVHILDGKSDTITSGEYVFIEPGSIHYFKKIHEDEKLTVMNCIFTPDLITKSSDTNKTFLDLLSSPLLNIDVSKIIKTPSQYTFHDSDNYIFNLLSVMYSEYQKKMTNYYLIMKNLLSSIIIASIRQVSSNEIKAVNATEMVKDYVSLHYAENNILNKISEISFYSTQYLSAKFKADTGENFKTYLQKVRCYAAEQLISCTNMTIPEISEAVGYTDVKYFQEMFKKHKNVTPKQLRLYYDKLNNKSKDN